MDADYSRLIWIGATAGRNWETEWQVLESSNDNKRPLTPEGMPPALANDEQGNSCLDPLQQSQKGKAKARK